MKALSLAKTWTLALLKILYERYAIYQNMKALSLSHKHNGHLLCFSPLV